MNRPTALLICRACAVLYVVLLPLGRSSLPFNAQWGDALFPVLALATALSGGPQGTWWRPRDWPLGVYLAVTLFAALVSPDPLIGFIHFAKQVYAASVFLVFRHLARDPSLSSRLAKAFVAAVAAVTLVSISVVFLRFPGRVPLAMFGLAHVMPLFGLVGRLRGAFEAPELLGNALLVAFILALGLRAAGPRETRSRWTAVATLLAVGEFLTFAHSVAGFSVAAVVFVTTRLTSLARRSLLGVGAMAIVLIVNVASVLDPVPRGTRTDNDVRPVSLDILGARVEGQLMSYAALKQVAWRVFLEHPVTGVGPGRFSVETGKAFQDGRLTRPLRGLSSHCALTGRLAETGVLGGVSLLLLWTSWLSGTRRTLSAGPPLQRAALAAVLGILVNSLNADVMNFRFLWLALAWAWDTTESPS